jgi:adenylate cyclase class 2
MLEIEKKYRLTSATRRQVLKALTGLGAVFEGDDTEENTIYGGAALTDSIVRIRKTANRALLTFKRRIENTSDLKEQIEHETEISDPDAADNFLRELRLSPKLIYEKRRSTWRLRNVEVVIDELPFGWFMEIEGTRTGIREVEMLLGIEDLETEHETYPRLTAQLGRQIGDVIEARFDQLL